MYVRLRAADVAVDNLTSSNFNQFIWYAKRIIFLIFFLYLKPLFVDARLIFALNAYVFSVCIFFAIFPVAPLIGLRLGNYFAIYELFLLAAIPALVEKRYSTISIFLVIFICSQKLYSALFIYESDLYIPYKSIYYNEDFNRNLY